MADKAVDIDFVAPGGALKTFPLFVIIHHTNVSSVHRIRVVHRQFRSADQFSIVPHSLWIVKLLHRTGKRLFRSEYLHQQTTFSGGFSDESYSL